MSKRPYVLDAIDVAILRQLQELQVAAADVSSFHGFLDATLRRVKGVLSTKSSIAMRQVKSRTKQNTKSTR